MIGERPNKKNIESLNLTQKVNILRHWCGTNRIEIININDNFSHIFHNYLKLDEKVI